MRLLDILCSRDFKSVLIEMSKEKERLMFQGRQLPALQTNLKYLMMQQSVSLQKASNGRNCGESIGN